LHENPGQNRDGKTRGHLGSQLERKAEIFNCPEAAAGLSWTQIHERIESLEKLKRTGARMRFDRMVEAGLLVKNGDGLYTRAA
jgi:hypothetical protein